MKLWDARNLGAGTGAGGVGGMMPLAEMPHFRSVNSAHFSPGGEWVATVGQDDKIRLYQDLAGASGSQVRQSVLFRLLLSDMSSPLSLIACKKKTTFKFLFWSSR